MKLIAAFFAFLLSALAAPEFSGELIFTPERWHNHSSAIVELAGGDLLVCWYHGSGERTADDVIVEGARYSKAAGKWSPRFTLADTPLFPDTNPTMFVDSRGRLFLMWAVIVANQWETALMKYRISTDYKDPSRPPRWEHQDNMLLIPKNMEARTKEVLGKDAAGSGPLAARAAKLIERAGDKY